MARSATRLDARSVRRPWGLVRVWSAGSGPPLLAVHGLGGSGRYWQGLADRVGDRYHVVAPDLAGFGGSGTPASNTDRAHHLDDLGAVVSEVAPDGPLTIVGHSLGSVLAALTAGRHTERLAGLALAAAPWPGTVRFDERFLREGPPSVPRRMLATGGRAVFRLVAFPIGLARGYPPAVVADFGRQSLRGRAWTLWSVLSDPEIARDLEAVRGVDRDRPVLLVNARDDRKIPLSAQGRWAGIFPSAERIVVPTGGHQFLLRSGFGPFADWLLAAGG